MTAAATTRRTFLRGGLGAAGLALIGCAPPSCSPSDGPSPKTMGSGPSAKAIGSALRRPLHALSDAELSAFALAFDKMAELGWLARLNFEHTSCHVHRQHAVMPRSDGASTPVFLATADDVKPMIRFLPWHRLFLDTMEFLLQKAYLQTAGVADVDRVRIPYWHWEAPNGAGYGIPRKLWEFRFSPKAGAANWARPPASTDHGGAPDGTPFGGWLPKGHPGNPAGDAHVEHQVSEVRRGARPPAVARSLAGKTQLDAYVATPDYCWFSEFLEWRPEFGPVAGEPPGVSCGSSKLASSANGDPRGVYNLAVPEEVRRLPWEEVWDLDAPESAPQDKANGAHVMLDHAPFDPLAGPHSAAHLFAARRTGSLFGTLYYYHETCFDPLFWMLHAQVDRVWSLWQQRHGVEDGFFARLLGDDDVFVRQASEKVHQEHLSITDEEFKRYPSFENALADNSSVEPSMGGDAIACMYGTGGEHSPYEG